MAHCRQEGTPGFTIPYFSIRGTHIHALVYTHAHAHTPLKINFGAGEIAHLLRALTANLNSTQILYPAPMW